MLIAVNLSVCLLVCLSVYNLDFVKRIDLYENIVGMCEFVIEIVRICQCVRGCVTVSVSSFICHTREVIELSTTTVHNIHTCGHMTSSLTKDFSHGGATVCLHLNSDSVGEVISASDDEYSLGKVSVV